MDVKVKPDYEEAYRLYQAGLSLEKVGEIIGVSAPAVHYAFKKRKLTMRGANFELPETFSSPLLKTG